MCFDSGIGSMASAEIVVAGESVNDGVLDRWSERTGVVEDPARWLRFSLIGLDMVNDRR